MSKIKKKNKSLLPLGIAFIGIAAALTIAIIILKTAEEDDSERDVENYDVKNVPMI